MRLRHGLWTRDSPDPSRDLQKVNGMIFGRLNGILLAMAIICWYQLPGLYWRVESGHTTFLESLSYMTRRYLKSAVENNQKLHRGLVR